MSVEIDESYKGLDFSHISGCQPVLDACNLNWVHLYVAFGEDESKVFNLRLLKDTFLRFEVKSVFPKDVEDLYYDGVVLLFHPATEDEDVVHIDSHNPFVHEFFEDVIHHHLESCQTVG